MVGCMNKPEQAGIQSMRQSFLQRFSLLQDKADDEQIERQIRDGVEMAGATPWILMFAIVVASVGLNVNSTAVIIGAMLISPLMGPIMGAGLGIAIYDFDLVKRALLNLLIATVISLLVSTLYFSLSPLQEVRSELLARTMPTVWDVIIAFFGGLAGVVGATRREKSNVIPGVAIATALMPPVCTAGFGLATGRWDFVGGALYLYTINCVFIAIATVIGIRTVHLRAHTFADAKTARRIKLGLYGLALSTALPSGYLAFKLVNEELFNSRARSFVEQEFAIAQTHVADLKIHPKTRLIEVSLIGKPLDQRTLKTIEAHLATTALKEAKIIVHQSANNEVDMTALRSSLLGDLYRDSQTLLAQRDQEIERLRQDAATRNALFRVAGDISQELRAQYPEIREVIIGEGVSVNEAGEKGQKVVQLGVSSVRRIAPAQQEKIRNWFRIRTKAGAVIVKFDLYAPKPASASVAEKSKAAE